MVAARVSSPVLPQLQLHLFPHWHDPGLQRLANGGKGFEGPRLIKLQTSYQYSFTYYTLFESIGQFNLIRTDFLSFFQQSAAVGKSILTSQREPDLVDFPQQPLTPQLVVRTLVY